MSGHAVSCESGYGYCAVYTGITGPVTTITCTTLCTVMAGIISHRHILISYLWLRGLMVLHLLAVSIFIFCRHDWHGEYAAQR